MQIRFKTDNSAFEDENKPFEIARILREIAFKVENDITEASISDINGNVIGTWEI